MRTLQQTLAIARMNLTSLSSRAAPSLVLVVGTAGVVAVLIAALALVHGFESTLATAGPENRIIALGAGSNSELNGNISREAFNVLVHGPGVMRAAGEIYSSANVPVKGDEGTANLPLRGVAPASFAVRPEVTVVAGRELAPGTFDMLVGVGAARQFEGLEVGDTVSIRGAVWRVAGHFAAHGSVFESEVWVDVDTLASVLDRPSFSTVSATLASGDALGALRAAVRADPRLEVRVLRAADYYAAQSESAARTMTILGYVLAGIMAVGAAFAALNTMYAATSARTVEIATLRALGFSSVPIVASVIVEALTLALAGGIAGAAVVYLFVDGLAASTIGGSYTVVAFAFDVTPRLLCIGVALALTLGLVGGMLPALEAARRPVTVALQTARR